MIINTRRKSKTLPACGSRKTVTKFWPFLQIDKTTFLVCEKATVVFVARRVYDYANDCETVVWDIEMVRRIK